MKYLISFGIVFGVLGICISLAFLLENPIKNSFKVGDCVLVGNGNLYKIIQLGKYNSYLLADGTIYNTIWSTSFNGGFTKVDCFNFFKEE